MIGKSGIPSAIRVLGFVSLLMDISSKMIHSLLPLFLVTGPGRSALAIGLIGGAAKATAPIVKVFSGGLSDGVGRRKELAPLGYGLGAATKPLFAIASSVGLVIVARLAERVGKGHPGRAAQCAGGRPCPAASARRGLRHAAIARYARRFRGVAAGGGADAPVRE